MRRFRVGSPVNYVRDTDNLILLLTGIFIGLVVTLVAMPLIPDYVSRYLPFVRAGVPCTTFAAPSGGNSRSMLSFDNQDPANLDLDIILENAPLEQGESLRMQVVFNNDDKGPIVLFMPQINDMILNSGATIGVGIQVQNVVTGQVLIFGIPGGAVPPFNQPYRDAELHLIEGHTGCSEKYEVDLSSLPAGEYSVLATYNNTFAGIQLPPEGGYRDPALAVDGTQGVWTSQQGIESPEKRFRIQTPSVPATQ